MFLRSTITGLVLTALLFPVGASAYGGWPGAFRVPNYRSHHRPAVRSLQELSERRFQEHIKHLVEAQRARAALFPGTQWAPSLWDNPFPTKSGETFDGFPENFHNLPRDVQNNIWQELRFEGPPKGLKSRGFHRRMRGEGWHWY